MRSTLACNPSQDGQRNGIGVKTYADGSMYDGFWSNNKKHGLGVYRCVLGETALADLAGAQQPLLQQAGEASAPPPGHHSNIMAAPVTGRHSCARLHARAPAGPRPQAPVRAAPGRAMPTRVPATLAVVAAVRASTPPHMGAPASCTALRSRVAVMRART